MDDREKLVLQIRAAAGYLVKKDELRSPNTSWAGYESQSAVIRYRDTDLIIVIHQGGIVVTEGLLQSCCQSFN